MARLKEYLSLNQEYDQRVENSTFRASCSLIKPVQRNEKKIKNILIPLSPAVIGGN
ncbi:hypothetical protein CFS9_01470 [Flavobacterium sp. CFS9]|uniref:Uncharacterized protein n=1 Tax=Flavobacterium sp. CFS9 TaxID=3143118 RepID=A0AAT9GW97_9FLAO